MFYVQVYLGELNCKAIQMELYAEPLNGDAAVREVMVREEALVGSESACQYSASVPATRPAGDFTPRIIPYHPAAAIPLEAPQILWYR